MLSKENTEFTQGFIAKIFSDCKNLSSVALGQCDVKTSTRLLLLSWKLFMLILEGSKKVKIKINIGKVKVNINSDWFLCHPPPLFEFSKKWCFLTLGAYSSCPPWSRDPQKVQKGTTVIYMKSQYLTWLLIYVVLSKLHFTEGDTYQPPQIL